VSFNDVKALAARLGVSMNAACQRADIAYSTQYRWGKGAEPGDSLGRLRAAIIVIAHERGALPADLRGEVPDAYNLIPAEAEDPHKLVAGMERDLRRLKRSLKIGAKAAAS